MRLPNELRQIRRHLLLTILVLLCSACVPPTRPVDRTPPVLLVSIDGFRADYLDRGLTPTLAGLAADGVHAAFLRPSFPTLTFPNHYTLVTGLRPDHHGVVANRMVDPGIATSPFETWRQEPVTDPAWWRGGKPIWISAEEQGLRSAIMFWPGSEAAFAGMRPSAWTPYDKSMSGAARVDRVLGWLDQPPPQRPDLILLYLDSIDVTGHRYGPDSPELDAALVEVDQVLRRLVDGLRERGLDQRVNLVVVSDHGMASVTPERRLYIDDVFADADVDVVHFGALTGFLPHADKRAAVEAAVLRKHEHMQCWRKADLPARFHFGQHPRIPPLLCLADAGWVITSKARSERKKPFSHGEHGYDNENPDMRALFVAHGPAFARGRNVPGFDNVDVYPLLVHLLGIHGVAGDDGDGLLRAALRGKEAKAQP